MPDLQKIHALLVPVETNMSGIKIHFKVSPSVTSSTEFKNELNRLSAEANEINKPDEMRIDHRDYEYALAEAVKEWDITDDGQKLPITQETVCELPDVLKMEMWNAASEALSPKNLMRRTPRTSSQRGG